MKPAEHQGIVAGLFTLSIVLLIAVAAGGGEGLFLLVMLAVIFGGVGSFYLIFPGSRFFSIALANCLAVYVCVFVFLLETNFASAPEAAVQIGVAFPVVAFTVGVLLRRDRIRRIVFATGPEAKPEILKATFWLLPMAALGAASFAVPRLALTPEATGFALLAMMGAVAAVVLVVSPSVCSFLLDAGLIFERFFDRIAGLLIPAFAFLTFYSLLVIVFACIYRILALYVPGPHFNFNGAPHEIAFSDSLYFSIVTLSTLGYGDIAPVSRLVRAIISVEIVAGVLLLLFGFSEIMRYTQDRRSGGAPEDRSQEPRP